MQWGWERALGAGMRSWDLDAMGKEGRGGGKLPVLEGFGEMLDGCLDGDIVEMEEMGRKQGVNCRSWQGKGSQVWAGRKGWICRSGMTLPQPDGAVTVKDGIPHCPSLPHGSTYVMPLMPEKHLSERWDGPAPSQPVIPPLQIEKAENG